MSIFTVGPEALLMSVDLGPTPSGLDIVWCDNPHCRSPNHTDTSFDYPKKLIPSCVNCEEPLPTVKVRQATGTFYRLVPGHFK